MCRSVERNGAVRDVCCLLPGVCRRAAHLGVVHPGGTEALLDTQALSVCLQRGAHGATLPLPAQLHPGVSRQLYDILQQVLYWFYAIAIKVA